jgi:toxin FitB
MASRPNADRFAMYIEGREPLLVSAIEVYEVYKVIRRDLSEERAVEAVSALRRATIAAVDESLALEAADLSLVHGLAMADSLVYVSARRFGATLVTGDADFEGLPDTIVVRNATTSSPKRSRSRPAAPPQACAPIVVPLQQPPRLRRRASRRPQASRRAKR